MAKAVFRLRGWQQCMMIIKSEEREHVDGAFQDNHRQFMEKIRNQIKAYNL